jgi:competence protein ComEA
MKGMRGFLLVSALVFGSAHAILAAEKPKLPDGEGKAATVRLCGSCHAAAIVMSRRESREGWSGVVEDMIQRGAKGSDDEFGEVVDYLVAHFPKGAPVPKINVNKADAEDIVAGLGVSDVHAKAIVKYRDEKGAFKSIDDLQKVPGIDAKAIEAKKNKLEF